MNNADLFHFVKNVLSNMPTDWLKLTTHRLDIYNEELAKVEFLQGFDILFNENDASLNSLQNLPTAYDYIRLGHPLSCILEWAIAQLNNLQPDNVISFSSQTIPLLAVLRQNLLKNRQTQIVYTDDLPICFDPDLIRHIYGYNFELHHIANKEAIPNFDGTTLFVSQQDRLHKKDFLSNIDFYLDLHDSLGSILIVNGLKNQHYIPEIQHVRRRETIAMTPADALTVLRHLVNYQANDEDFPAVRANRTSVINKIREITGTNSKSLIASSGLSMQYAIMMGLIHEANERHPGKKIKFVVPPNCYGGTNDQARRVAACIENVDVLDLPVDGTFDMVQSLDKVLDHIANIDAIPYIIAEIPTNPRVEVPNLQKLRAVLIAERKTINGETAIDPVFVLDQTFCPNVQFLGEGKILSEVKAIAYVSGSKFPSGGLCTAGYCVGNKMAESLMDKIEMHLLLCDNQATDFQIEILARLLPSMNKRIQDAYLNTREFVDFIRDKLPSAKINFVSEELAQKGFTPSVFSLDLPTKGNTDEAKEAYKRALNHKLIKSMITNIPNESKYCVSYGQLKGCYWTIPATSTQGTTKEGDKDYIARVSISPELDLEHHKLVFEKFVHEIL